MAYGLPKIEALDDSPLDVPGRPLAPPPPVRPEDARPDPAPRPAPQVDPPPVRDDIPPKEAAADAPKEPADDPAEAAPPSAKEKADNEKRLPPRLRKKQEEEQRRKQEKAAAAEPPKAAAPDPAPKPSPPAPPTKRPEAQAAAPAEPPKPSVPEPALPPEKAEPEAVKLVAPAPRPPGAVTPFPPGLPEGQVPPDRPMPPQPRALAPLVPQPQLSPGGPPPPESPDAPRGVAVPEPGGPGSVGVGASADTGQRVLANLKDTTDISNCLMPLLEALHWRGDPRHVAESIPHFVDSLDITSFRNIMATLHYESRPVRKMRLSDVDPRLMPCVFLPDDGDALVLLGLERRIIRVFDGGRNDYAEVGRERRMGTVYFFTALEEDDLLPNQQKVGWFRAVGERFRGLVYQTLGITFILNVLALATPLFVMAIYDKVVNTGSMRTLAYFAAGVGIAILCDLILRNIRTKILAHIGARLDNIVGIAIFHKILFLQPAFTERSTIGAQVARIKDFETIRDFFTGPLVLVMFELPFVIIFIVVIFDLGGPVAFVPLIMVALYGILSVIFTPLIRNSVSKAARAGSRKQELVVESLGNMRAIKYCGAETTWIDRFRKLSAKSALNSFYTSQWSSLVQTMSTVLMTASGVGTIVFGVFRILEGEMSIGGLVASMMLVWRVLGPLQTAFVSMARVSQVRNSVSQINALMNIRAEREQHSLVNPLARMEGFVTFNRVSIRYSPDTDPALVGVSFEVEPGEVVCIVGGNGSGKSTALKLAAGMYLPQAGSIRIDNQDIRQMDPIELRHAVAYVPQAIQFFYGTIAQNLRLAHPTATEEEMRWACKMAAVLEDVEALEQGSGKWKRTGFDVRIGDSGSGSMPTSLLQRLNLARGFLKRAPIMLFDEPGNGLDFESDQAFMRAVDELRGFTTTLIVTHRPSHLKMADKIVWLEYGNVRAVGPAEEVLQQMPKDFL